MNKQQITHLNLLEQINPKKQRKEQQLIIKPYEAYLSKSPHKYKSDTYQNLLKQIQEKNQVSQLLQPQKMKEIPKDQPVPKIVLKKFQPKQKHTQTERSHSHANINKNIQALIQNKTSLAKKTYHLQQKYQTIQSKLQKFETELQSLKPNRSNIKIENQSYNSPIKLETASKIHILSQLNDLQSTQKEQIKQLRCKSYTKNHLDIQPYQLTKSKSHKVQSEHIFQQKAQSLDKVRYQKHIKFIQKLKKNKTQSNFHQASSANQLLEKFQENIDKYKKQQKQVFTQKEQRSTSQTLRTSKDLRKQ